MGYKTNYYILQDGILKRKENTVYFINKEEKRLLPINKISSIFLYGQVSLTSGVVSYLSRQGICVHFYDKYGNYLGSYYPRDSLISGEVVIKQAEHFINNDKRMFLAKGFVEGAIKNISKNMKEGNEGILEYLDKIKGCSDISSLMGIEGNVRSMYYSYLDDLLPEEFKIIKRTRQPPTNMFNALLSFGNSLLYGTIVSEIYNTQLNPSISYLHEPFYRRYSLSLDIAEIFKPIIVDRIILKLINKKMIDESHFRKELNYVMLNDKGKRLFLREYEEKLRSTILHKSLNKHVSYQHLIRLELYKLIKHILGIKTYKPFVMWW